MKRRFSAAASEAAAAVEYERRRLSQELHQHLNQSLTGLSLMLEAAATQEDVQGHAAADVVIPAERWARILQLAQMAIRDAHRLHDRLAPLARQHPDLARGLEKLVAEASAHLTCELHCEAAVVEKIGSAEMQTALYRIAQEAIENVARHAQASHLEVRCELEEGQVRLAIADDGRGCDSSVLERSSGGGYLMECHAKAIGATLRIYEKGGGGSVLECVAPLR